MTLQRENDAKVDVGSCVFCSNLIYVTVSEDGDIKSSVVAPKCLLMTKKATKFSVAAASCGNRELPENQTISTFSCLL